MSSPLDFLMDTFYLDRVGRLFRDTFKQWNENKAPQSGRLSHTTPCSHLHR